MRTNYPVSILQRREILTSQRIHAQKLRKMQASPLTRIDNSPPVGKMPPANKTDELGTIYPKKLAVRLFQIATDERVWAI